MIQSIRESIPKMDTNLTWKACRPTLRVGGSVFSVQNYVVMLTVYFLLTGRSRLKQRNFSRNQWVGQVWREKWESYT